ncbi:MAG: hypothetical protein NVS3B21_22740 [Acidimicrobiales bacterium]
MAALVDDPERIASAVRLLPRAATVDPLDKLADLAAHLLGAASAQISLLTTDQTVAGGSGLAEGASSGPTALEDSLCAVAASSGVPLMVADAPTDVRVAQLGPVVSGAVGSYLGVPLRALDGSVVGALCVFEPAPRTWSSSDTALLEMLAPSVVAQLELLALAAEYESSRLRWDVAIDAAGIGSFDWDLRSDHVEWDERLQAVFGYVTGEFIPHITEALRRIHPEDRPIVDAAIAAAVESCGDYRAEFRMIRPSGEQRWIAARGRAIAGSDGRAHQLIGTAYDTTEVRTVHDRAAHLLATMVTGFASLDHQWRVTYINANGERVVGLGSDELVGRVIWDVFPGLEDLEFGRHYHRAAETGEPVEFEAYYPHLDGWYEVRVVPGPDGLGLYFLDISERHAAQERSDAANARLELLATVSAELAATLDAELAVSRLAQLVVPTLCDWCIVTLVEDDQRLNDIASWHTDAALRPVAERYSSLRIPALAGNSFVARAFESREPTIMVGGAAQSIGECLVPGEARNLLVELAPESAAVLPLLARGRTVGLLTLYRGRDRPPLSDVDLAVAKEVAVGAGMALDNARLYAQQRAMAESLQRSLLTAPPEPDHCQIVVRYAPAVELASVGGDWFDAFLQADGATMLVIGDVVGHDTEAAAAMGQVRSLLRGIAWYSGAGPANVLSGLDAAMKGLQVDTTATAVIGRLEQAPDERERGVTRLRWSNAGHPPPMAVHPDGTVTVLAGVDADLLLGIDPESRRIESEIVLDRGSTVLFYTDGLVERRGQSLEDGLALLRDTLGELWNLSLDSLCDQLVARLGGQADDDVAIVAVRLHRQDLPRPPEAGPERLPPEVPTRP